MHTKKLDNGYIHYLREGTPRIAPFLRIEDLSLLLHNDKFPERVRIIPTHALRKYL